MDTSKAGDKYLYYTYYYSQNPGTVYTSNVFLIAIVNACNPHNSYQQPTITATAQSAQTFTITDTGSWTINFFETVPEYCVDEVQYSYDPNNDTPDTTGTSGDAFSFDSFSDFEFDYSGFTDLSGNTVDGTHYVITIEGELGGITTSADIDVTILNPCLDQVYYALTAPTFANFEYTLFETSPDNKFVHPAFDVTVLNPEVLTTCGDISYDINTSFNGGLLSPYISYNSATREITIYAEDRNLVPGPYEY